jgi:signal transduction histidine kinase
MPRVEGLVKRLRLPPLVADSVLAVALFALTLATVLYNRDCACPFPWWGTALIAGQTLPLALRRRAPVPVWAIAGVFTGVYGASSLNDPPIYFGGLVALYTVASLSTRRTSYLAAAVTAASMGAAIAASGDTAFVTLSFNVTVFAIAWILGDSVRVHRAYTTELEARAARLERERHEEAARAAAEERVRIARELHDVVAHHVSVIAVQSQAAEVLLPAEPERAASRGRHRPHRPPGARRAAPAARRPPGGR